MKISFIKVIVILCFCYIPFQSRAWGVLGHRIVGEVAESYLTAKAKKEIIKILGNETLAMSANWADFIKSDPSFGYLYNWHFINLPGGMSREQVQEYLEKDTATDAFTRINFLSTQLKTGKLNPETKVLFLRMLIHLVGDIHQPMHVGRLEDLGGNKVKVLWFRDSSNLHQVWDERLINFQQLSYTEYARAINFVSKAQKNQWSDEPVSAWVYESYQYADKIYADIKYPWQKLDYRYNFDYIDIVNRQLLKAGIHLAALLNKIFGN